MTPEENKKITIHLSGQAVTENLARQFATMAQTGDVFALEGDLGVGKTVFARAFIRALSGPNTEVPSPTFTLVQIYDSNISQLYHFDLYRLENADEALELGIDEALAEGISLIEWPERLGYLMPSNCLTLTLAYDDDTSGVGDQKRLLDIDAPGNWKERLREADIAT